MLYIDYIKHGVSCSMVCAVPWRVVAVVRNGWKWWYIYIIYMMIEMVIGLSNGRNDGWESWNHDMVIGLAKGRKDGWESWNHDQNDEIMAEREVKREVETVKEWRKSVELTTFSRRWSTHAVYETKEVHPTLVSCVSLARVTVTVTFSVRTYRL